MSGTSEKDQLTTWLPIDNQPKPPDRTPPAKTARVLWSACPRLNSRPTTIRSLTRQSGCSHQSYNISKDTDLQGPAYSCHCCDDSSSLRQQSNIIWLPLQSELSRSRKGQLKTSPRWRLLRSSPTPPQDPPNPSTNRCTRQPPTTSPPQDNMPTVERTKKEEDRTNQSLRRPAVQAGSPPCRAL